MDRITIAGEVVEPENFNLKDIRSIVFVIGMTRNARVVCHTCGVSWPLCAPELSCTCAPNEADLWRQM